MLAFFSAIRYPKLIGFGLIALAFAGLFAALQLTRAKLDASKERNLRLTAEIASLVDDSKRRKEVGREALQQAKVVKVGREAQRARIVVQQAPGCPTPPDAADILAKGW